MSKKKEKVVTTNGGYLGVRAKEIRYGGELAIQDSSLYKKKKSTTTLSERKKEIIIIVNSTQRVALFSPVSQFKRKR